MKELIIKVDEEKMDIEGTAPIVDRPQELVRCKDCKHLERLPWLDDKDGKAMICRKHAFTGMRLEDWYCADGEKDVDD